MMVVEGPKVATFTKEFLQACGNGAFSKHFIRLNRKLCYRVLDMSAVDSLKDPIIVFLCKKDEELHQKALDEVGGRVNLPLRTYKLTHPTPMDYIKARLR